MQRICRVRGGVKAYLQDPGALVTQETRQCPFCATAHLLWLYGWYERWVVLPAREEPRQIAIRRLRCRHTGQTVSLLPDFCIPRRQCGVAVLALFLQAYVRGAGLLESLRGVRREVSWHSSAQSLLRGFLARAHSIRTYLSQRRQRWAPVPRDIREDRRPAAELFLALTDRWPMPGRAFVYHGRRLHQRTRATLA